MKDDDYFFLNYVMSDDVQSTGYFSMDATSNGVHCTGLSHVQDIHVSTCIKIYISNTQCSKQVIIKVESHFVVQK